MTDIARLRADRIAALPFERVEPTAGIAQGTSHALRQLWRYRELQGLLVRRELKARYKDSSLGFIWSFIRPVMLLLIYYFAIGYFLQAQRSIPVFGIFVFAGLVLWGLYSDILVAGTMSILTNAGLIKKVSLPREIFPLASAGSAFVNFLIQCAVLIAAVLVFGQMTFTWDVLYVFPAVLLVMVYGTAFAILLSALNVYLRDIQYLVEVVMLMLFWTSPIVYSYRMVADVIGGTWLEAVYLANPITVAILSFQRAVWLPSPSVQSQLTEMGIDPSTMHPADLDVRILVLLIVGLLLLWVSHRTFLRLQGNFAQEI
ncbi:ABC transporter permease [Homoserinibacter sp. GY 40078]|uniref:ABC transporter permease n=1 Tax=Homoserinibacter sp. GY 40078 TaxID=2603275 RepID=UPI0011CACB68|nr:ABC transporter permease [Homoserinibacter sp. GY 40078]TXK16264.1 ABC transporter permease [Homoserinibacter sp. GY 40078]